MHIAHRRLHMCRRTSRTARRLGGTGRTGGTIILSFTPRGLPPCPRSTGPTGPTRPTAPRASADRPRVRPRISPFVGAGTDRYGCLRMGTELRFCPRRGARRRHHRHRRGSAPAVPSVIFRFLRTHPYPSVEGGRYAQVVRVCVSIFHHLSLISCNFRACGLY